jgi:hypothetical protein
MSEFNFAVEGHDAAEAAGNLIRRVCEMSGQPSPQGFGTMDYTPLVDALVQAVRKRLLERPRNEIQITWNHGRALHSPFPLLKLFAWMLGVETDQKVHILPLTNQAALALTKTDDGDYAIRITNGRVTIADNEAWRA